jgi:hypothetical protein
VDLHGFGSVAADLLPQHRAELQKIEELEYCVVMQSKASGLDRCVYVVDLGEANIVSLKEI